MSRNLKRMKKPVIEKKQNKVRKPPSGEFWIVDIALHATYYPSSLAGLKRTYNRLNAENKELKTSHPV